MNGDALMRRRFAVMKKARDARNTGIIVSTKSGQQRIDLARRLESLSPTAVIVTMQEVSPGRIAEPGI